MSKPDVKEDVVGAKDWYNDMHVTGILKAHEGVSENDVLRFEIPENNKDLEAALKADKKTPTLMVFNLNKDHWTGGILVPSEGEKPARFYYNDSLNGEMPKDLQGLVREANISPINLNTRQQDNSYDCGPWTVNNLKTMLEVVRDGAVKNPEEEMKKRLLGAAQDRSAAMIRMEHAGKNPELFGGQEAAKVLEAALLVRIAEEEEAKKKLQTDENQESVLTANVVIGEVNAKGDKKKKIPTDAVFNEKLESLLGPDYEDRVERKDGSISSIGCKDSEEAKNVSEAMVKFGQEQGLDCQMDGPTANGSYVVKVKMPKGFEGRDPFSMNEKELAGLRVITGKEKSTKDAAAENPEVDGMEKAKEEAVANAGILSTICGLFSSKDSKGDDQNSKLPTTPPITPRGKGEDDSLTH